jgi:hypothetical protein
MEEVTRALPSKTNSTAGGGMDRLHCFGQLSAAAFQKGSLPSSEDAITLGRAERQAMKTAVPSLILRVTKEGLTLTRREP